MITKEGFEPMKYTLHRALTLKKTTAERIDKEINNAKFIAVRQGKKDHVNGVPVETVIQDIKSSYQKITQLISNYFTLKAAILQSNAGVQDFSTIKRVTVAGKRYTMAELIAASDELYGNAKYTGAFYPRLLSVMKQAYFDTIKQVERQHEKIENNIRDYLSKAATSDKGMTTEEIQRRSEMFHEDGDYVIIDPLGLRDVIDKLDAEIKAFRVDADATISEQNALNTIDVNLTTVD